MTNATSGGLNRVFSGTVEGTELEQGDVSSTHSMRLPISTATRSPRTMPQAASPAARRSVRSSSWRQVTARSSNHNAIASGRQRAQLRQ